MKFVNIIWCISCLEVLQSRKCFIVIILSFVLEYATGEILDTWGCEFKWDTSDFE
jgi:hypothetical protein